MFDVIIRQASLRFGNHCVFTDLNLTLKGGQWTCLLGGSGVGKTSLLRLIAGLPAGETTGEVVSQDGFSVHHRIAWMAQQDLLLPWFSVLDNITLGQRLRRNLTDVFTRRPLLSAEVQEQAMSILEKVGLSAKADVLPQHLSGGQRQRVALARTLMENRPLVLMDEPFGALDAITRLNLQDLACELLQNRTVLLITHDPLEALRLGHEVYHLRGHPARLTDAITPPGKTPRSLANNDLMRLQAKLLDRLRHESFDEQAGVP
ncbi:ABC transporter ATP-binding protein [Endozoicomonas sp. GU-1]|uniref:ABC transporter ATP-binding protein n=1 Tax=Endozoicomonas sp. GU-1 TaxID=3009078 RepID=UPI0022B52595|nr:ABC transporter ATP-binding protein [Endozoicomonas sp. GU-1]WBA82409.1 ABC transporter ATP-binding protein [Endozoicomonas sp. GU-1]WBA85342.1 ABC transporter ATP-binding protein [Endozoicomonas sp. GU-1]